MTHWVRAVTVALLFAVVSVFAFGIGSVLAVHYTFWQEDPDDRAYYGTTYPYNAVTIAWSWYPGDTNWDDDGSMPTEVVRAIASWENAVPELGWVNTGLGEAAPLYFKEVGWCGLLADACTAEIVVNSDDPRQADYLWEASIIVHDVSTFTPEGKEDILRHEIGHWIGLDEQYIKGPPVTCSAVESVMNTVSSVWGTNCLDIHAPTSWDVDKARQFWGGDGLESAVLSEPTFRNLQLTWSDAMWSEAWEGWNLAWWDRNNAQWVEVASSTAFDAGIGFHQDSIPRTMSESWDIQANGWPVDVYYTALVRAFRWPYNSWNTGARADPFYVD